MKKAMCFKCCGDIKPNDVGKYFVAVERLDGDSKLVKDFLEKAEKVAGPTPKLSVCESCAKELGLRIAENAKEMFGDAISLGVFGAVDKPKEKSTV
jgi:hypothetical protein